MNNSKGTEYIWRDLIKAPRDFWFSGKFSQKVASCSLVKQRSRNFTWDWKTSWGLTPSTTISLNKVNNIELKMKMTWTAEIQILNEDMIVVACTFSFPNSDHVMFSREFAFCLLINYVYICTWMHVNKTTFDRNSSLGYHRHIVCNGKTKHTS